MPSTPPPDTQADARALADTARLALAALDGGDLPSAKRHADEALLLAVRTHAALRVAVRTPFDRLGRDNPHGPVDVTGDLAAALAALGTEDVREYCREANWEQTTTRSPRRAWTWSRHLSAAQRELMRRGEPAESWRDGAAS